MILDFPVEDYEPLSAQEIKDMNEGLGTANLNESEIWNVISGLEESISEKLNVETGGKVTSVELTENFEIVVTTSKSATIKETAKVQEVVQVMNKTKAVETLKKEVIAEVIKETKKETIKVAAKNEEKETKEEESNSEVVTTSIVQKSKNTKQKKVQSEKTVKPKLKVIMAKIDDKVKDPVKNLELKNLVKIDAMTQRS